MSLPIGITQGDASGVGPEIILRASAAGEVPPRAVVIGDLSVLQACRRHLGLDVELRAVSQWSDLPPRGLAVWDMKQMAEGDLRIGRESETAGRAALAYVDFAARAALRGQIRSVVTLPMNKAATRLSCPGFTGHTEYIAELCGISDYSMMLASTRLLVGHVSTHVSLLQAIQSLTPQRVLAVTRLVADAVRRLGRNPRIAVTGLNPHAGEGGAFGREDIDLIEPGVREARAAGIDAHGPLPADTVFYRALQGDFGAVVVMYHDQGHAPMKAIAFDEAVNVTIGLPIVRTSVDHGTAFDIAWKGQASTASFVNACRLADQLTAGPGGSTSKGSSS